MMHCNVHCSSSLAYFVAAVGSTWALRHSSARENSPSCVPSLPAASWLLAALHVRRTKATAFMCVKCRDGFHQCCLASIVTLAIPSQTGALKVIAWQRLRKNFGRHQ